MCPSAHLDKYIHWTRRTYPSLPSLALASILLQAQITWFQKLMCCKLTLQGEDQFLPEAAGEGMGPVLSRPRRRIRVFCWLLMSHSDTPAECTPSFRQPWAQGLASAPVLASEPAWDKGMLCYSEGDWLLCPLNLKGGCLVYSSALSSLWLSAVKWLAWQWWLLSPRNFLCIWSDRRER